MVKNQKQCSVKDKFYNKLQVAEAKSKSNKTKDVEKKLNPANKNNRHKNQTITLA